MISQSDNDTSSLSNIKIYSIWSLRVLLIQWPQVSDDTWGTRGCLREAHTCNNNIQNIIKILLITQKENILSIKILGYDWDLFFLTIYDNWQLLYGAISAYLTFTQFKVRRLHQWHQWFTVPNFSSNILHLEWNRVKYIHK